MNTLEASVRPGGCQYGGFQTPSPRHLMETLPSGSRPLWAARREHHPRVVRCQHRLAGWSDDLSGSRYQRLWGWLPPIGWMALIFLLSSRADFGALSRLSFPSSDKVAHAVIYGVLAVLVARAVAPARWASGFGWAISVGYGVTDEYHQSFVPGRDVSAGDLLADALGAAVALIVYALVMRRRGMTQRRGRP